MTASKSYMKFTPGALLVLLAGCVHATGGEAPPPLPEPASTVKAAAVQIIPDHEIGVVRQVTNYMERAAADGARIIVFPEYHLGHIKIPGPETEEISEYASRLGINVIVGCFEVESDEIFYNTALLIDERGEIAGRDRRAISQDPPGGWGTALLLASARG